ncbi:hypothetical protein [Angustibacter aerolatus]
MRRGVLIELRRRVAGTGRDDEGIALLSVMGSMLMLTLFLLATLSFTLQNLKPSRNGQDGVTALAAAQAGIDDYVSRLNTTPGYWRLGNVDATNQALPNGRLGNYAGIKVPGADTQTTTYKYQVLSNGSDVASQGVVRLRSTGTKGSQSRTLTASLAPNGFLNYIYHTNFETLDPLLFTGNGDARRSTCAQYWYKGRPDSGNGACTDIGFGGGDVINGPIHTNDSILMNGVATFANAQTETSWNAARSITGRTPPSATTLYRNSPAPSGNKPYYAPVLQIPADNTSLKDIADPTNPAYSQQGCVYTGATRITFTGSTMTVYSPNTKGSTVPLRCYNVNAADKTAPQTGLAIPPVIYVDTLSGSCGNAGGSQLNGFKSPYAGTEYVGTGVDNFSLASADFIGPTYKCDSGNAFVSGELNGATTLAAAQDIVVVGDITYSDTTSSSDDVLGLIPGHFVWVWHPVAACTTNGQSGCSAQTTMQSQLPVQQYGYRNLLPTPISNISAAILAVDDSFITQNYRLGPVLSTNAATKLNVFGAIAQQFRGTVATTSNGIAVTGYIKNYVYDARFQHGMQPPYFLQPSGAVWSATSVSDDLR